MSLSVHLSTALSLFAPDVFALQQGQSIMIPFKQFLEKGKTFALYPIPHPLTSLTLEETYHPYYLPNAKKAITQLNNHPPILTTWARCEQCQILDKNEPLEAISHLTIWKIEALENILSQRPFLFLVYLRVYHLPQPIEFSPQQQGLFLLLPQPVTINDLKPILNDATFNQRTQQLEKRLSPTYPELLTLYSLIASYPNSEPLQQDIDTLLGWSNNLQNDSFNSELSWIKTIANTGNSSDGNEFEKLVRKSFIFLGFSNHQNNAKISLDPNSTGGAGGLDFYADFPYPIVGECKATKTEKVPDGTPAQLIKLGHKYLQNEFNNCIKLVLAAGELTQAAELTAKNNQINVMRPETLQRLIELKATYTGSINLMELKTCLENEPFGEEADTKINQYIDQIYQQIKLRSHIINLIKEINLQDPNRSITTTYLQGRYDGSNPPQSLTETELTEILIELSSPLIGYLGRQENNGQNEFYFLRELPLL